MPITLTPLSPAVGLEVTGLSGGRLVGEAVASDCRAAVSRYGVVVYREAHVDDDELVAFSRLLGDVLVVARGAVPGHPEVAPVARDRARDAMAHYREGTFHWHIDGTTDLVPNKATLLSAVEVSGEGGDTEFADTYAALEALPEAEQAALAGVRVVHSFAAAQLLVHPDASADQRTLWEAVPAREHPLVWTRNSGRRSLLVGATADQVVGRPADEGDALLGRLLDWCTQPRFVVRHQWRRGDLVVWDNTGLLHRALPYEAGSPRLMHRTTIAGEEAVV